MVFADRTCIPCDRPRRQGAQELAAETFSEGDVATAVRAHADVGAQDGLVQFAEVAGRVIQQPGFTGVVFEIHASVSNRRLRKRLKASRVRDLTVPTGRSRHSAISRCERPST